MRSTEELFAELKGALMAELEKTGTLTDEAVARELAWTTGHPLETARRVVERVKARRAIREATAEIAP